MHKVDSAYMPPSVCFICTASPTEPVCDTLLNFDPGILTPRNGRIYVCQSCAQTCADALGLFDAGKQRVVEAEAKVTEIEKRLEAYASIEAAIEVVRPTPVVETPAPAEKPKKAKSGGATTETLAAVTDPPTEE